MTTDHGVAAGMRMVDVNELGRWRRRRLASRFYAEVLVPAFAPEELRSRRDLLRDLFGRDAGSRAWVALDGDGSVLGGAVADVDEETRVVLGAYMAVSAGQRARGIGSKIRESFLEALISSVKPSFLLGEVQDPRVHPVTDQQDPVGRLRLYERVGCRLLLTPYVMPKLRPSDPRVPGMMLVSSYVDPSLGVEDAVPAPLLASFLRHYFRTCEGEEVFERDPAVAAIFAHLASVDEVPLRPLHEYVRLPVTPVCKSTT